MYIAIHNAIAPGGRGYCGSPLYIFFSVVNFFSFPVVQGKHK